MTRYRYQVLVAETRVRSVSVEVDVPDGKSPWGPAARQAADEAALATPAEGWGDPRTKVTVTWAREIA